MRRNLVVAVGFIAASFVIAAAAGAQTGVISGVIYDESNRVGLQGAQVAIKGTELVGVSGKDGKFIITGVPAGPQQVEAWRVGYRSFKLSTLRIAANDTTTVYLALASNAEDPATPASETTIQLRNPVSYRSNTKPLIIIDGVIQPPGTEITSIQREIQSIEVIRGAAATQLYGDRAVDGVIAVTTRRED
jgi:TonB-dependent SusC/RagA subfamily outer membrane receptor